MQAQALQKSAEKLRDSTIKDQICNPINPRNNLAKLSREKLEKSRASFQKLIVEHQQKIANPQSSIDLDKAKGDPIRWVQGLLERKWPNDISRFQREIDKIDDILNNCDK